MEIKTSKNKIPFDFEDKIFVIRKIDKELEIFPITVVAISQTHINGNYRHEDCVLRSNINEALNKVSNYLEKLNNE